MNDQVGINVSSTSYLPYFRDSFLYQICNLHYFFDESSSEVDGFEESIIRSDSLEMKR